MQELQKQNGALGEKRSNCAIWQPVRGVMRAVHALNESRCASVPAAAAPLSLAKEGLDHSSLPRGLNKSIYSGPLIGSAFAITSPVAALLPHPTGPSPGAAPAPQPVPLSPALTAGFQPRNPWQPESHHCSPTGETQTQTQSCLWKNSNRLLRLCFRERTSWIKNVPRTTGMALLYFHKEVSPNCTLTVFSRTNLFPPSADSRRSPSVCVCAGGGGGGELLCGTVCTSRACADGIIVYFFNFQR